MFVTHSLIFDDVLFNLARFRFSKGPGPKANLISKAVEW